MRSLKMDIGRRVQALRKERRMTLEELARKSGVAKATLSRIENQLTPGTMKTHLKICEALALSLAELYKEVGGPLDETGAIDALALKGAEVFTYNDKASSVLLTRNARYRNMFPQLILLKPGGKTNLEQNPRGTEKFLYCLDGSLQVNIADKAYQLGRGSSLYFQSSLPHQVKNTGRIQARCLVISSPVAL